MPDDQRIEFVGELKHIAWRLNWAKTNIENLRLFIRDYKTVDIGIGEDELAQEFKKIYAPSVEHIAAPAIGDIIHNLRACYDHYTYALTVKAGKPSKRVVFPNAPTKDEVISKIEDHELTKLGFSKHCEEIIGIVEPFGGGQYDFFELNRLDRINKHRAILTVSEIVFPPIDDWIGENIRIHNNSTIAPVGKISLVPILCKPSAATQIRKHESGDSVLIVKFGPNGYFDGEKIGGVLNSLLFKTAEAMGKLNSAYRNLFGDGQK